MLNLNRFYFIVSHRAERAYPIRRYLVQGCLNRGFFIENGA